jgi:cAMP-dependent protein kinase regulator
MDQKVVHPKSDAQRRSLMATVKNILLFRSLEPDQLGEVLDAMFLREVQQGEYIIQQGDDGDNFYVIDRYLYYLLYVLIPV